jgi:glycosyltransferase involved in cell wall biosynthesis
MLWSQTLLPWWAACDRVEVFWGATHRLPRFLPQSIARVVTIHDLVWKKAGETMRPLSRWMEARLMPQAIRDADLVMADSLSTARDIREAFPAAEKKVRVVYPGTSPLGPADDRKSLESLGIKGPYFLFVGTLEPRKNLRRLLEAFAAIPEQTRAPLQMVIAGDRGWGGVDVGAWITEFGLERHVVVTGRVSDRQLATLYEHALFLAMPSLYEGFGFPVVEAMSRGVPALVSNISSLPEAAGEGGLLVDPHSVASIAKGLTTMITNDAVRESLAAKAILSASRFSWEKSAREALEVFAEAIEIRKAARKSFA